jgi:hypothetical protein
MTIEDLAQEVGMDERAVGVGKDQVLFRSQVCEHALFDLPFLPGSQDGDRF